MRNNPRYLVYSKVCIFQGRTHSLITVLMMLYIFMVDKLPLLVGRVHWWSPSINSYHATPIQAPCSNFKLDPIWTTNVAAAISDSQIELVDIDRDNVSDIVIGVAASKTNGQTCNHDSNIDSKCSF